MDEGRRIVVGPKVAPELGRLIELPEDRAVWVAMDDDTVFIKFKNQNQSVELNVSHEATLALVNLLAQVTKNGKKLKVFNE